MPQQEKHVLLEKMDCAYLDKGEGAAVVLVHGWGQSKSYWQSVLEQGQLDHRFIAYDIRGMGSSGLTKRYRFNDLVEDLREFLDAMRIDDAIICGHSLGSLIALRFASKYPARTLGVISTAAPADSDWIAGRFISVLTGSFLELLRLCGVKMPHKFLRRTLQKSWFSDVFGETARQEVKRQWSLFVKNNNPSGLARALFAMGGRGKTERIETPVFAIYGEKDRAVPPKGYNELVQKCVILDHTVMCGTGHMLCVERDDEFLGAFADGLVFIKNENARRSSNRATSG